jgi:AcrR family transcriptional regulator
VWIPAVTADAAESGSRSLRSDARRNRQRVLDAAEAAFASEGITVPIDEIARRAGVGAGTVYRHFPTKEGLVQAIRLGRLERMTANARSLAGAQDPGAAFFGFLAAMVEEGIAKRDLVDALTTGGFDLNRAATTPVGQEFRQAVADLMARAQHEGAVRRDVGVAELMVLLRAISLAARNAGEPSLARRLVGVISDGLRPGHRR